MIAQTAAYQLSGLLMLKSAWIPFLLGTPLYLLGTSSLLLLPAERRVKTVVTDTTTDEDSQGKAQSAPERIMETSKRLYQLIRDNFAALVFVATWILAYLPGHPFILIFISKKFDTTFSTVRIESASTPLISLADFNSRQPSSSLSAAWSAPSSSSSSSPSSTAPSQNVPP